MAFPSTVPKRMEGAVRDILKNTSHTSLIHNDGAVRDILRKGPSWLPHAQHRSSSGCVLPIAFLKSRNELFCKASVIESCPPPCHVVEIGMPSQALTCAELVMEVVGKLR